MGCLGHWTEQLQWLGALAAFLAALGVVSLYLLQYAVGMAGAGPRGTSAASCPPGPKEDLSFLLKWVLSLTGWRRQWQVAWVAALNEEAKHKAGPLLLTFEEDQVQKPLELTVQPVVNAIKSVQKDQIIGMLDLSKTLKDILRHLVSSVSPSMILSTKTVDVKEAEDMRHKSTLPEALCPPKPPRVHKLKLLVKNIQVILLNNPGSSDSLNCCFVTQLNDPLQKFSSSVTKSTTNFTWDEVFTFELNAKSKELQMHVLEDGKSKDNLFFALATVPIDIFKKKPSGEQCFVLNSGSSCNHTVLGSITAEFFYIEPNEPSWKIPPAVSSVKMEDQTVMPCGTTSGALMVTSITAMKTSPRLDMGRFPTSNSDFSVKTPIKVKVIEKDILVQAISCHSAFSSSDSELLRLNDSDPVAEAAIQQLSHSSELKFKSPRKKSTIIIEGESKVEF
ncbi:C2 domain-containing protein 2 isoform X2 [Macrotis lagotis]|uniref:C2 domain-containing protein 2 isoform X2 n=1 Tax=Macrotis lagotis TaxID=92651 RepID=UPI003D69E877